MPETTPRQFRLTEATLADLDRIAEHLRRTTGRNASRADAIRHAVDQAVRKIPDKTKKTS